MAITVNGVSMPNTNVGDLLFPAYAYSTNEHHYYKITSTNTNYEVIEEIYVPYDIDRDYIIYEIGFNNETRLPQTGGNLLWGEFTAKATNRFSYAGGTVHGRGTPVYINQESGRMIYLFYSTENNKPEDYENIHVTYSAEDQSWYNLLIPCIPKKGALLLENGIYSGGFYVGDIYPEDADIDENTVIYLNGQQIQPGSGVNYITDEMNITADIVKPYNVTINVKMGETTETKTLEVSGNISSIKTDFNPTNNTVTLNNGAQDFSISWLYNQKIMTEGKIGDYTFGINSVETFSTPYTESFTIDFTAIPQIDITVTVKDLKTGAVLATSNANNLVDEIRVYGPYTLPENSYFCSGRTTYSFEGSSWQEIFSNSHALESDETFVNWQYNGFNYPVSESYTLITRPTGDIEIFYNITRPTVYKTLTFYNADGTSVIDTSQIVEEPQTFKLNATRGQGVLEWNEYLITFIYDTGYDVVGVSDLPNGVPIVLNNGTAQYNVTRDFSLYLILQKKQTPNKFDIVLKRFTCEENRLDKTNFFTNQTTLSGTLREACDVLNPVIYCEIPNPNIYNYCSIELFGNRSYFIKNFEYVNNKLVRLYLHVDVLQTYKDMILNLTPVISRTNKLSSYTNVKDSTIIKDPKTKYKYDEFTGGVLMQPYDDTISCALNFIGEYSKKEL
jgi:hypothetical protein